MLERGFLTNRTRKEKKPVSKASNLMTYGGVVIICIALVFMLLNLEHVDSIKKIWLPLMGAGVVMVFLSHLIRLIAENKEKKQNNGKIQ